MSFRRVFSDAPWEARVGYCRALRSVEIEADALVEG